MLQRFRNDDSAVSPVIGVILMVAITVILAAVIASFVLGLGDADDPAPQPTVNTDFSTDELEVSITGGDDFEVDVSTVQAEVTVEDDDGNGEVFEFNNIAINADSEDVSTDIDGDNVELTFEGVDSDDEVTAGDSMVIELGDSAPDDAEIASWEIEVIWDPADQDSEIIISESS